MNAFLANFCFTRWKMPSAGVSSIANLLTTLTYAHGSVNSVSNWARNLFNNYPFIFRNWHRMENFEFYIYKKNHKNAQSVWIHKSIHRNKRTYTRIASNKNGASHWNRISCERWGMYIALNISSCRGRNTQRATTIHFISPLERNLLPPPLHPLSRLLRRPSTKRNGGLWARI